MKHAVIFHGTGQTERNFWYPWVKDELQAHDYTVWLPTIPMDKEGFVDLEQWKNFYLENTPRKEFDIVIGHSAGVPNTYNLLSQNLLKTKKALMVAGFINPIPEMSETHQTFPKNLNDEAIKKNCESFTFIHSDNDPGGCDHIQGEAMRQRFVGTLIVKTGEGHFGSEAFGQPYSEFPMLLTHAFLDE